jgi:hypothetical protein
MRVANEKAPAGEQILQHLAVEENVTYTCVDAFSSTARCCKRAVRAVEAYFSVTYAISSDKECAIISGTATGTISSEKQRSLLTENLRVKVNKADAGLR